MYLKGKDVILMIGGTAIAAAKSCDVNIQVELIKVSSASDGAWEHSIAGRKSWSASCSHLITQIADSAEMVGQTVTLTINTVNIGLPIRDFLLTSPTIEQQSALAVDFVVWDDQAKRFLGCKDNIFNRKYYINWLNKEIYTEAPVGSKFCLTSTGSTYTLTADGLIEDKLSGPAIVKEWKLTAARGNLAQGSFRFEGVGPLATPT